MANFIREKEVTKKEGDWRLCFQYGVYKYDDGSSQKGYRFIWRDAKGNLKPQRAQARIPNAEHLFDLLSLASQEGWLVSIEKK